MVAMWMRKSRQVWVGAWGGWTSSKGAGSEGDGGVWGGPGRGSGCDDGIAAGGVDGVGMVDMDCIRDWQS
jgi:hypothetical protein